LTNLYRRLRGDDGEERESLPLNFQDWVNSFVTYNGVNYPYAGFRQTLVGSDEEPGSDGFAAGAYSGNAIVFACMTVRAMYFSEARFQFQQIRGGRPGNLFGTPELALLEQPWPNGTTGDLLAQMIQDVDIAGNSYTVRVRDRLARLRPDWMSIMLGSRTGRESWAPGDADTEVAGYVYWPGGPHSGHDPITYAPFEIAHLAPIKDPAAVYRGMSWLTPLIREVQADGAMTQHKLAFLRQGATVNLVVKFTTPTMEDFDKAVAKFRQGHEGVANAYKTLFLAQGTDVIPVGTDLAQMEFANTQASGELRIASAAQVPAVILGLREGLQGSTLNSGNFNSSRRMFADGCILPLWRFACAALASILNVPPGSRLWYDDRDVPFLKEDLKDTAQVQQMQAAAASSFVQAGYEPQSIVDMLAADDITLLKPIEGVTTVQLQPLDAAEQPAPAQNGGAPTIAVPPE
jgi:phage portal protein BeeE